MGITVLLFFHIRSAGLFYSIPLLSVTGYWILLLPAFGLLLLSMTGIFRTKAQVTTVTHHNGIIQVTVKAPPKYRYRAGQFAFIRARNASGKVEEHPFSFLSSPEEADLRFGIRMSGDFTNHVSSLEAGAEIELSRPFGNFRPDSGTPFVSLDRG